MSADLKIKTSGDLDEWLTNGHKIYLRGATELLDPKNSIVDFNLATAIRKVRSTFGELLKGVALHDPKTQLEILEGPADMFFVGAIHKNFLEEVNQQKKKLVEELREHARGTFYSLSEKKALQIPENTFLDDQTRKEFFISLVPAGNRDDYQRFKEYTSEDIADHYYALSDGFDIKEVLRNIQTTYSFILRKIGRAPSDILQLPELSPEDWDEDLEEAA